jgi:hypothetical protein
MKTEADIKKIVDEFISNKLTNSWEPIYIDDETEEHVKRICVSILCTKHKIGYPGGSFVQAVVNNDLMGAFGKADHINKNFIGLYAELLYNH